jgi:hypothetical protein
MSSTITAQAIPSVALGDWETIDEHLRNPKGDWVALRGGLLHLVCDRVTREGDPVTRLEELLLLEHYRTTVVHTEFRDVLRLVRTELSSWSTEVANLVEHLLAQNPNFPVGEQAFPLDLERLRVVARRCTTAPEGPIRGLGRFHRTPARRVIAEEGTK